MREIRSGRDGWRLRMDGSKVRFVAAIGLLLVVVGAATARATDGQPVLIGQANEGAGTTEFDDTTQAGIAVRGASDGGTAIAGKDVTGTGVMGITSTGIGIQAISGPDTGSGAAGGRRGRAARVTGATTLRGTTTLRGKVVMKRSGVVSVRAGDVARTVSDVQMSDTSMVIALAQQHRRGVFVTAAVPSTSGFTLFLNEPAPQDVRVAWVVIG
jgi:hypothetical protein